MKLYAKRLDGSARRRIVVGALLLAAVLVPQAAFAHGDEVHDGAASPGPRNWAELWRAWEWDPLVIGSLAVSGALYALGLWRLWRKAGAGHGATYVDAACFAGGWLTLVLALVSPLHQWGGMLFSVHMTQHEILMLVVAPLMVLSRPLVPFLKALPLSWTRRVVRWTKKPAWAGLWGFVTRPLVAWVIGAVVLWVWHVPVLFEATLHSDLVHALQHVGFLLSALLFWWAVMNGRHKAMGYGVAVLYLFMTALHSGLLGALITFAARPWYPTYTNRTLAWGLTAMEDQELGGLIMWIPACTIYIFAGLALFAAWMRSSEERVLRWESQLDLEPAAMGESTPAPEAR